VVIFCLLRIRRRFDSCSGHQLFVWGRCAGAYAMPGKPSKPAKKTSGTRDPGTKTRAHSGVAKSKSRAAAKGVAGEPKLLSGGNPQIPKGYGDASVQAYIA